MIHLAMEVAAFLFLAVVGFFALWLVFGLICLLLSGAANAQYQTSSWLSGKFTASPEEISQAKAHQPRPVRPAVKYFWLFFCASLIGLIVWASETGH